MSFNKMMQILQKKNKSKIILCELGYFYIAIGKDAILLNKLIGLKLNCIKPEICKIGFPINSLEKYEKLIKEKECSYMVLKFDHTKEELKIIRNYNGKYNNEIVKLPFESYFNKNICVFGSSGSMKTTAFLLTNLLELSKYRKSIIVTDPKAEIYRTTSSYFKSINYTVKVLNLKDMKHSDRWNPLAENENINDVQMSANTIIMNTQKKNGKDEFWPRAEENLLKAFEFYFLQILVDQNNLTNIYKKVAGGDLGEIDSMFKGLPNENPAKLSYNIFASGSDTIKASVITGLGTRLQTFQNEDLQRLTSASDIDLTLPGKEPCIYYVITDDMNGAYDFLSSLFYAFLFIKLVRYADSRPNGRCDVDVFCFLDEFANIRSNSRI